MRFERNPFGARVTDTMVKGRSRVRSCVMADIATVGRTRPLSPESGHPECLYQCLLSTNCGHRL